MPIEILAAMVVAGLAIAIGAVYLAGLSKPAKLSDAGQAKARFAEDYPRESVAECRLTAASGAAFLRLDSGRIGLVTAFGAKFVTRLFEPPQIRAETDGDTLRLAAPDFTFRQTSFVFADAAEARRVAEWMNGARSLEGRK